MNTEVQTIAPVQKKKVSKKPKKTDEGLVEKIARLQRNDELVGNSITFRFPDGGFKVTQINKHFVTSESGRNLPVSLIIENINALQWDFGATSFDIE